MTRTRCPKCRDLGLPHDCAERIIHARKDKPMSNPFDEDGTLELEVTLNFAVPVTSSLDLDPYQMATHMRETWTEDSTSLVTMITEALGEDYDLQVRPVFTQ